MQAESQQASVHLLPVIGLVAESLLVVQPPPTQAQINKFNFIYVQCWCDELILGLVCPWISLIRLVCFFSKHPNPISTLLRVFHLLS